MSDDRLRRIQVGAAVLGLVGLAASLGSWWFRPDASAPSYLFGFVFWLNLSLGAWALLMVHRLVGGDWGEAIGPTLRAAARVLPALAILFLPVLVGVRTLYPWARPGEAGAGYRPSHLSIWLSPGFFAVRSGVYFLCWIAVSWLQGRRVDDRQGLHAGGLVLYGFTLFFASVDWVLSIEPRWSSSIYGLLFIADQAVSALALGTGVVLFLPQAQKPQVLIDLGNLLLTAVLLWTYLYFSQYLIIWSEDLPREIPWIRHRTTAGWQFIAQALIVFHFAVPLLLLLFRRVKSRRPWLAGIAIGLLALRLVDVYWRILPPFETGGPAIHAATIAAPLGIGGLWVAFFVGGLRRSTVKGFAA